MTTSQTPAPQTTSPVWGSWKTHGNLSALVYFGQDRKSPAAQGKPMVVGILPGSLLSGLDPKTGATVLRGGVATRFWATPDMTAPVNQPDEIAPAGDALRKLAEQVRSPEPTKDAKAIQNAAKAPKRAPRNGRLHDCLCGCKGQIKGLYKQGHDARHASAVAKRAIAALASDPDLNLADNDLLAELPTDALKAKAAAIIAKHVK